MTVERRSIHITSDDIEVRASEDGSLPTIRGYTAVFDQEIEIHSAWGSFRETIRPGAFRSAIDARQDVRALFNHDANNIFARTKNNTLKISEDERGLYIEAQPADTSLARDLVALIERGDVTGMSFAFTIKKVRWEENSEEDTPDLREILEIEQLYDVGPVVYPAYDETTAHASAAQRAEDWQEIMDERSAYLNVVEDVDQPTPWLRNVDIELTPPLVDIGDVLPTQLVERKEELSMVVEDEDGDEVDAEGVARRRRARERELEILSLDDK